MCEDKRLGANYVADWKVWVCSICHTRNHQDQKCHKCGKTDPDESVHIYNRLARLEKYAEKLETARQDLSKVLLEVEVICLLLDPPSIQEVIPDAQETD